MSEELTTTYRGYAIQRLSIRSLVGPPAAELSEQGHHRYEIFNPEGLNVGRESSLQLAQNKVDLHLKAF